MKATKQLIEKLRSQMPPEASKQLDELAGMMPDDEEGDMAAEGDYSEEAAPADEPMPDAEDSESVPDDEEAEEEAPAPAKKAKKSKPSFFM